MGNLDGRLIALDGEMGISAHPPESRRLFVAGSIRRIISGLNLGEPLHAVGVNLGNPGLEGCALHFVLDFAITEGALLA
jgi:hypothetical protein